MTTASPLRWARGSSRREANTQRPVRPACSNVAAKRLTHFSPVSFSRRWTSIRPPSPGASLQPQDPVHPPRHLPEPLLVPAPDLRGGPAVVAHLRAGLQHLRPVLVPLADAHVEPLALVPGRLGLGDAVALEVELEHPLAQL